ncbi:hypothetical protein BSNK01_11810 [Bacillaceae bacterium]
MASQDIADIVDIVDKVVVATAVAFVAFAALAVVEPVAVAVDIAFVVGCLLLQFFGMPQEKYKSYHFGLYILPGQLPSFAH